MYELKYSNNALTPSESVLVILSLCSFEGTRTYMFLDNSKTSKNSKVGLLFLQGDSFQNVYSCRRANVPAMTMFHFVALSFRGLFHS